MVAITPVAARELTQGVKGTVVCLADEFMGGIPIGLNSPGARQDAMVLTSTAASTQEVREKPPRSRSLAEGISCGTFLLMPHGM